MERISHLLCRLVLLFLLLPVLFPGCSAPDTPAYDPAAFSCILAVDSVSTGEEGRFTAVYVRENEKTTLTLTAPERLAGIFFTFAGEGCVMTVSDTAIPLSENTAASLRSLTALLAYTPEEAEETRREGENTVFLFSEGQLTVNAEGFPVLVECTGRRAQVLPADTGGSK
ncbi:MAG: hypothetical protein IKY52_13705 [Clostridia bacterium]|nr:hypothetical protein [Clostridia bacterium]